jgi:hypothetical protein
VGDFIGHGGERFHLRGVFEAVAPTRLPSVRSFASFVRTSVRAVFHLSVKWASSSGIWRAMRAAVAAARGLLSVVVIMLPFMVDAMFMGEVGGVLILSWFSTPEGLDGSFAVPDRDGADAVRGFGAAGETVQQVIDREFVGGPHGLVGDGGSVVAEHGTLCGCAGVGGDGDESAKGGLDGENGNGVHGGFLSYRVAV